MSHFDFVLISLTNGIFRVCAFNVHLHLHLHLKNKKLVFSSPNFKCQTINLFWFENIRSFVCFFRATVKSINKFYWNRMDRRGRCILNFCLSLFWWRVLHIKHYSIENIDKKNVNTKFRQTEYNNYVRYT